MTIWDEKKIDSIIKKVGYANVWCRTHDRPHMAMVDPLTLTMIRSNPWGRGKKYLHCCSAHLELPQVTSCIFIVRGVDLKTLVEMVS